MVWASILLGGCGFIFAHRYRIGIDERLGKGLNLLIQRIQALFSPLPSADEDLELAGRLISSLQAGISLDSALENAFAETALGSPVRIRLRGILDGRMQPDFLSSFLRSALDTGMPALSSLQNLERALRSKRKLTLKARAMSGQCRAQAEVLTWLPWSLGLSIACIDFEWFSAATGESLSWFLWALAILLSGMGRKWISHSLKRVLSPQGNTEIIEEETLPDFTLRVIAAVSQGKDVESAYEHALFACGNQALSIAIASASPGAKLLRLRSTLRHASRTGAPVREELTSFLQDLQSELESRWEERVQRLPVALLAPLFLCFFPSSLLVLAGLLIPILKVNL